jgi:phosphohistidine phosphatase
MRKLIIVRHAHAVHDGADDFSRNLTRDGLDEAAQAGKILKKNELSPDMIISSSAMRAMQTAKKIAHKLNFPEDSIVYDRKLYAADEDDMLRILKQVNDSHKILMVVGHNPALLHLASSIASKAIGFLPPGGIIVIEFPKGVSWSDIKPGSGASASALNF